MLRLAPMTYPQYFDRLTQYFPQQELKPLAQFEDLLGHTTFYKKFEDAASLVLYADFSDFLFIDFFLVDKAVRRQGIGAALLKRFMSLDKAMVLEVEPENPDDPDTILRRKFYLRHGFQFIKGLMYRRINAQGKPFDMDIFAWSPDDNQHWKPETVLKMMARVYEEVHNFHASEHLGRQPVPSSQVLWLEPALQRS